VTLDELHNLVKPHDADIVIEHGVLRRHGKKVGWVQLRVGFYIDKESELWMIRTNYFESVELPDTWSPV